MPTKMSLVRTIWRLIAFCGLTPDCGIACVSHLTGNKTTDSASAWRAFQSLMVSDAACRSSAKSEGEAISTRYVCDLNDIGVVLRCSHLTTRSFVILPTAWVTLEKDFH